MTLADAWWHTGCATSRQSISVAKEHPYERSTHRCREVKIPSDNEVHVNVGAPLLDPAIAIERSNAQGETRASVPPDVMGDTAAESHWFTVAFIVCACLSGLVVVGCKILGWSVEIIGVPIIGMTVAAIQLCARQRSVHIDAATAIQDLQTIRDSETRFQSAFTHAAIGMALATTEGTLLQVNDSLCRILERTAEELNGKDVKSFTYPKYVERLLTEIHSVAQGAAGRSRLEVRMVTKTGETVWCAVNVSFFNDGQSGSPCLIFQIQDVTSRRRVEMKLHHVAYHDLLTELPNRVLFNLHLKKALKAASSPVPKQFAVMYLDFDRFKVINDSLGHKAGDVFLSEVALRLKSCLGSNDVIARLGGDEFAILLTGLRNHELAFDLARDLLVAVRKPVQLGTTEVTTSVSIGITFSDMGYHEAQDVLRDADIAMYKAKSDGKAQFAVFDAKLHDHVSSQLQLESDLRKAVNRDELIVHYQPLFGLRTMRLVGFEALVRWKHPEHGMIDPGRFIPIAEEAGLIVELGKCVFAKACQQLSEWSAVIDSNESTVSEPLTMNVNVSAVQLAHSGFADFVTDTMHDHGVRPGQINLEVTESVLMDAEGVVPVMRKLRDMGIRLSIDDFGTGFSSLSYLHSLPFDTIKIDRSFVERMSGDGKGQEIVRSIVALARALGKSLVAEGIETETQLMMLRELQCDEGQGYYFAPPHAPEKLAPLFPIWRAMIREKRAFLADDKPSMEEPAFGVSMDRRVHPTAPCLLQFSETII